MIKIAHITTIDLSLKYLLLNQLKYLREQGYQVAGISSPGPYVKDLEVAGIRHLPIPISRQLISPLADLVSLIRLICLLRAENFQIVHVHTPKASFLGQIAARIAGVPIVIRTLHGFYFHEGTPPVTRRAMIWMERFAGQFADAILSQNKEDIQTAVDEKIFPSEKISYLGNGIDIQRFAMESVDPEKLERLRKDFGLDPNKRVVGFVGRLVAEKGVLELFQAARELSTQLDDVQYLFVGPVDWGKKDSITPEAAAEFGISEICKFVGFQEEMPLVYSLMDVFVLPSHREGFPRSLMEASAMGVPSIATDIRGCREVIQPGENGLLVPLNDPGALVEALKTLLTDAKLAAEMGHNGQVASKMYFDENNVFEKVLQTYHDQLNRKLPS
ncbi:MAG: glycosyltransferase family 4 protein [Chloroflexi bacterium]|nr:glycosyltransferase family 4 protein [Chloroflexota bacterium]